MPAIKVLLLPEGHQHLGTIFGGVILSHIDLASAVEARKTAPHRFVTKAIREVEFHAPVFVGDIVNFYTETLQGGTDLGHGGRLGRGGALGRRRRRAREGHRRRGRARGHRRSDGRPIPIEPEARSAPMIAAFAPATVSNVAAGFDVLGFALDEPGDVVVARLADDARASSSARSTGDGGRLSRDPGKNTAGAAAQALLAALGTRQGIVLDVHKGLPLASGVGSSGASAVAAVVAVNELLGRPASLELVCQAAMQGEQAGCGAVHPDNVAPSLYGGFVLARSVEPPDIVRLPVPAGLSCAVLHPHLEVQTGTARALLGDTVPLATAVRQWANLGALVSALHTGDLALLSRSLVDHVAEPKRARARAGLRAGQGRGARGRRARLQPVGIRAVDLRAGADRCTAARVVGRGDGRGLCGRARASAPTCGCRRSARPAPASSTSREAGDAVHQHPRRRRRAGVARRGRAARPGARRRPVRADDDCRDDAGRVRGAARPDARRGGRPPSSRRSWPNVRPRRPSAA